MSVRLDRQSWTDAGDLLAANVANRDHHRPWVEPPLDPETFDRWFGAMLTGPNVGWIARDEQDAIVGVVNLTQIVWGPFRSAFVGYYGMAPFARRGLMTKVVSLAVDAAFNEIGLHRVEANIQPDNLASIALVKRLGFKLEGFSPNYLRVGGQWRDHERWAMLAPEWKA